MRLIAVFLMPVKEMKVKFILILLTAMVVGCQNAVFETPTIILPTLPQFPTSTLTPNLTMTPFASLTPSATPYPTFPPYPTKQIVFSYSTSGNHSSFDVVLGVSNRSSVVLYSDGQLIISGKPYHQKQLSSEEVNQLFSQLEVMGFYTLETNQQHDSTDLLYDFKGQYEETYDGLYICVLDSVKDRKICVRDHLREFLIPSMKNILQFLDSYEPKNMSLYQPDRLLLNIMIRRYELIDNPEVIPWSVSYPTIETDKWKLLYVEGEMASQIFSLYGSQEDARIVNANGVEYYVIVRPILPHEKLSWYR
jgi:hypothetical protein